MKVYQRSETGLGKWIVAAIAFLIVMTVTFADVYGVGTPSRPGDGRGGHQDPLPGQSQDQSDMMRQQTPDPSPIPEPSTMILMGIGLGAAAISKKYRKAA